MKIEKALMLSATCLAMAISGSAFAQQAGRYVGNVGAGIGYNSASEVDTSSPDKDSAAFYNLDASFAYDLNDRFSLAVDANYRKDKFSSNGDLGSQAPSSEYTLGLHALAKVGSSSRAGVFLGYGDTRNKEDSKSDSYNVQMYGVEGRTFLADNIMAYGQLGYGKKVRDGEDSDEGFKGGLVSRVGANYFMTNTTALNFDFEFAHTRSYIDGDDKGRFFGVKLGGETQLPTSIPLSVTYFARYNHISSTTEDDFIDEKMIGVGINYYFGATSSLEAAKRGKSIGLPTLPTRASVWTEWMD